MTTSWPPKSPKAALLSSPSGRRKYQQFREHRNTDTSPLKHTLTKPNLQCTSRRLFDGLEDIDRDDIVEDEDEETLQLKLAAIEAKLKLKKLQQSKARSQAEISEATIYHGNSQPQLISRITASRRRDNASQNSIVRDQGAATEVPTSPTKKSAQSAEQRSPGRVLLGIDKGFKGNDISLRRASRIRDRTFRQQASRPDRPSSRPSTFSSVKATTSSATSGRYIKSFSDKVAEDRSVERSKEHQRVAVIKDRSTGFKLNPTEMESLRLAAEEAQTRRPPRSVKHNEDIDFRRDDVSRAHEEYKVTRSTKNPNRQSPSGKSVRSSDEEDKNTTAKNELSDASLFEPFSQLYLSSRILPHTFLQRTLADVSYTSLRLPQLLKSVHAPLYELPESVIDYVVFGIVASKSSPQDHKAGMGSATSAGSTKGSADWEKQWEDGSQNQKKFMVLQLTDLTWSVDFFLFGTALPRYHRLSLGTVVAILNPGIMPPKKGKEDTGAFGLTLHSGDDTILEIGTARDLGFCKAVKKDGKECSSWVNSAKAEYCEWHLNAQISKTQAGRMGVNTGSNGSGLGGRGGGQGARNRFNSALTRGRERQAKDKQGLLPRKHGQRFDSQSGSHYFIAPSVASSRSSVYHANTSPASLLDMDDDPFISEGQFSRDKESRLRKRLVTEEKERNIARNLAQMNSGGAGGEYIRQKLGVEDFSTGEQAGSRSAVALRVDIMHSDPRGRGNRKRPAESVRLSPMKKTRLATDTGIRHPGRESLEAKSCLSRANEDDDDLDII